MRLQKTVQMTEIALMTAVLCVLAPFTIPVPMSPVPLSPATFAIYLTGALLGAKRGIFSVLIYLLLGMVGLPVFSGFSGGAGVLLGPTGGYIMGYLPCVLVVGLLTGNKRCEIRKLNKDLTKVRAGRLRKKAEEGLAMLLGTLLCYFFGTVWFMIIMDGIYSFSQVLLICVIPYLPFDLFKILAAVFLAAPIRKVLRRIEPI